MASKRDKPVQIFVMGSDTWRTEADWPLPDTTYTRYYLHSDGRANTAHGTGMLSRDEPSDESEDVYLYDPRQPVPTVGGATFLPGAMVAANSGPRDQRTVEMRSDVLCYTSAPLQQPRRSDRTHRTGAVRVVVRHRIPTSPASWLTCIRMAASEILTDGILRARYRESPLRAEAARAGSRVRAPPGPVGDSQRLSRWAPAPTRNFEQQFSALQSQLPIPAASSPRRDAD